MRILNVSAQKPDSTGSGTYLSALVRAQLAAGHEPAVLCGAAPGDTQEGLPDSVPVYAVHFETAELPFAICGMSDVMPYPSTRYRDLTPRMTAALERSFSVAIECAVAEFCPDVVLCHHLYLVTSLVRELVNGVPVCGICHSTDLRQMRSHGLERDRIIRAVRDLDAVFALHDQQAGEVVAEYGVDPARVLVVGTGYDHRVFCRDDFVERRPGSLLFVGKVCEKKGVASLLEALLRVDPGRVASLVLVGGHAQDEEFVAIERAAAASPVPVTIPGLLEQHELVQAYRESEVFVLPSFFEGLPLVAIEALACGCKVVMTELPGVRSWLERALPDAPVTWVRPPRMTGVDTPDPADLPRFEQDLARALECALAASEPRFSTMGVSWDACSGRILDRIETILRGGIDDRTCYSPNADDRRERLSR